MSVNPLLLPVRKDIDSIRNTVLTNIVKMLYNRKWINKKNVQKIINELIASHNDDELYKIQLDVSLSKLDTYDPNENEKDKEKEFDDKYIMIKLLPQKVTSITKSPIIMEFLNAYKKTHKILIVDDISDKSKHQLVSMKHTEIFKETFLMLDLLEHACSPKYEVLTQDECKELLEGYHLLKRQMKRQYDTDPVSLYLFLKTKQIIRIIRNSELTGSAIDYRIVVPHKIT